MLSFWEKKYTSERQELLIVGSGIVGCSAAISFLEKRPGSSVLLVDRGVLPNGASTKNAGFACFGSVTELMDDMSTMPESEVLNLVSERWKGLHILKSRLSATDMSYNEYGGYEVFQGETSFKKAAEQIDRVNDLLRPLFSEDVFTIDESANERCGFHTHGAMIYNRYEGQLDPMKMMAALKQKAISLGVKFLTGAEVDQVSTGEVRLVNGMCLNASRVLVATNGFASSLIGLDVKPARAQVLITEPIKNLPFKGVFHMDSGYYYFRNVGDRVLFGGGRNLDFEAEFTTEMSCSARIQEELDRILNEVILPGRKAKIAHRWAGIMGLGDTRKPIVKEVSRNLFCAVRLGGMGVALGSLVGEKAAMQIHESL